MSLLSDTMVLIIEDAFDSRSDYVLVATKGSIARAMSFKEYEDYCNGKNSTDSHLQQVKQSMVNGERFPFMFVKVTSPSKSLEGSFYINDCEVGKVAILDRRFFQVIEDSYSA